MREVKIVTSPISFIALKELIINRVINDHGKIQMEGYIESKNEARYRQMLLGDVWMELQAVGENDETRTLFNGIVTDFSLHASEHNCVLALTIMTGSYLMDTLPHFRSFQNTSDRYLDILEIINEQYDYSGVIGDDAAHNPVDGFFLQYNETDWAFAKRLASKCGRTITPGIEREGVIYYFGLQNKANYSLPDNVRYRVRKNLMDYRIKKARIEGETAFPAIKTTASQRSESLPEITEASASVPQDGSDNSRIISLESPSDQLTSAPKGEILSQARMNTAAQPLNDTEFRMVSDLKNQMTEVKTELSKGNAILAEMGTIDEQGFPNTLPQHRRTTLETHYSDAMGSLKNSQGLVSAFAAKTSEMQMADGLQAYQIPSELNVSYSSVTEKLRETRDSISKLNGNLNSVITRTCPFEIMASLERQCSEMNSSLDGCHTLLTDMMTSLENASVKPVPEINAQPEDSSLQKPKDIIEIHEHDCMTVVFEHREIFDLFDRINVDGLQMIVSSIESRYIGQELLHTYVLSFEKGLYVPREYNLRHNGVSLPGVVKNVKEDVVQISLYGDENDSQKVLCWLPYSTIYSSPDGTGWYCMPEIGDTVRMHIPERDEDCAYVISAVHMETGNDDRKDPDIKSIKTKYGKEVRFTPDSIVITNNAGMAIEISDSNGISIVSDKNISLTAKGSVSVSSDEGSVTVAGDSTVNLKQSGSSLTLDGDINMSGGDLRVH